MWNRFQHRALMKKITIVSNDVMVAGFGCIVGMVPGFLIGELAERKKTLKN